VTPDELYRKNPELVEAIAELVDLGYCPWCEEADSEVYRAHEGHDPECPLA
jgi:hypothetical protein